MSVFRRTTRNTSRANRVLQSAVTSDHQPSTSPAAAFDDDELTDLPSSDPPALSSDPVSGHLPSSSVHPTFAAETSPVIPTTDGPPILEPIPSLQDVGSDDDSAVEEDVPYGAPYPINNPHLRFVDDFGHIYEDGDRAFVPRGRTRQRQPTTPVSGAVASDHSVPSQPQPKRRQINLSVTPSTSVPKQKGNGKSRRPASASPSPDYALFDNEISKSFTARLHKTSHGKSYTVPSSIVKSTSSKSSAIPRLRFARTVKVAPDPLLPYTSDHVSMARSDLETLIDDARRQERNTMAYRATNILDYPFESDHGEFQVFYYCLTCILFLQ